MQLLPLVLEAPGRSGPTVCSCPQVLLCNPLCILGYTVVSWRFFRERIEEEELSLINFFADDYVEYKKRVPTGLPFISGIHVN